MENLRTNRIAEKMWRIARPHVLELLAESGCGEEDALLGGGGVLAERWGHRQATDLECRVPAAVRIGEWTPNGPADARRAGAKLAEALSGQGAAVAPDPEKESVRVTFRAVLGGGCLTLRSGLPPLLGAGAAGTFGEQACSLQSTAQILAGKCGRYGRLTAADAVDLAAGARETPSAAEAAVNDLPEPAFSALKTMWRAADRRLAEEAAEVPGPLAPNGTWNRIGIDPKKLGSGAAKAAEGARYSDVELYVRGGRIHVGTRSRNGRSGSASGGPDRAATLLVNRGLGGFFGRYPGTMPSIWEIANEAARMCESGEDGEVAVIRGGRVLWHAVGTTRRSRRNGAPGRTPGRGMEERRETKRRSRGRRTRAAA